MKRVKPIGEARKPHELRIRQVAGNELQSKIQAAVAWRAYQLYETRGYVPGHEVDDWMHAEAEVVAPLQCGALEQDHRVCLTTDASYFDEGPIEMWLEPRRMTLCGFDPNHKLLPGLPGEPARTRRDWIFRVHEFAVELDPAGVTARFNGPALDIYLVKAGAHVEPRTMAAVV
jgi:hypothetical protein